MSMIGVLPVSAWGVPAVLLLGIGLLGVAYSWWVWRRMRREGIASAIDLEDRIWYATVPAVAYSILALAGVVLGVRPGIAGIVLAVGVCLLLLAGIRNAWDMTTWIVLRRQD